MKKYFLLSMAEDRKATRGCNGLSFRKKLHLAVAKKLENIELVPKKYAKIMTIGCYKTVIHLHSQLPYLHRNPVNQPKIKSCFSKDK